MIKCEDSRLQKVFNKINVKADLIPKFSLEDYVIKIVQN